MSLWWVAGVLVTWVSIGAAEDLKFNAPANQVCPDKQGSCPDDSTCCMLATGKYGCCPLRKATCCEDHIHCCPHDYTCSVKLQSCVLGQKVLPWVMKKPAIPVPATPSQPTDTSKLKDVMCPGGHFFCPKKTTCCKLESGAYGCCPLPEAVCCSDHEHCCPNGYTCTVTNNTCVKGAITNSWIPVRPARTVTPQQVTVCSGGKASCPGLRTCCSQKAGTFGCCPYAGGICCDDMKSCCPYGFLCSYKVGKCIKSGTSFTIPLGHPTPADPREPQPDDEVEDLKSSHRQEDLMKTSRPDNKIKCSDNTTYCPEHSTCCELPSGKKCGCCPMAEAMCCEDKLHCCPHGTTCNTKQGTCTLAGLSMPWVRKVELPTPVNKDITCPDKKSTCPVDTTCCQMLDGYYGCCPHEQAVCCKDHLHCCPHGEKCDNPHGSCVAHNGSRQDHHKIKPLQKVVVEKACQPTSCPKGTTCCEMLGGRFGCCQFEKAVCCPDHAHCCPSGTTCNKEKQSCDKSPQISDHVPFSTIHQVSPSTQVKCDATHFCPDSSTCCMLSTGEWGCCPVPKGVCCKDHIHCCPQGYTCDVAKSTCERGQLTVPWVTKIPAVKLSTQSNTVLCPDKSSQCPDRTTCCLLLSGQYGCCPLPNATCCKDKVHCCPSGLHCDETGSKCTKSGTEDSLALTAVLPISFTLHTSLEQSTKLKCKDGTECADGNTCCPTSKGHYSCCPFAEAVCCNGSQCCPAGFACDPESGTCTQAHQSSIIAKPLHNPPQDVKCPDHKTQCPGDGTCCPLGPVYGCCPMPKAVCCKDHVHCCPRGYSCSPSNVGCIRDVSQNPFQKLLP